MLGRALLRLGGCWLLAAVFLDLWRRVLVVGFLIMLAGAGPGLAGRGRFGSPAVQRGPQTRCSRWPRGWTGSSRHR